MAKKKSEQEYGRVLSFRSDADIDQLLDKAEKQGIKPADFLKGCVRLAMKSEDIFWRESLENFAKNQKVFLEEIMKEIDGVKNSLTTLKTRADRINQEVATLNQDITRKEETLTSLTGQLIRVYSENMELLRNLK